METMTLKRKTLRPVLDFRMLIPPGVFEIVRGAAKEAGRYAVNDVLIGRKNGKPYAVAIEGRVLVWCSWTDNMNGENADFELVVPRKLWLDVRRKCASKKQYARGVLLNATEDTLSFMFPTKYGREFGEAIDAARIPDTDTLYPKYRRLLGWNRRAPGVTKTRISLEAISILSETIGAMVKSEHDGNVVSRVFLTEQNYFTTVFAKGISDLRIFGLALVVKDRRDF